MCTRLQTVIIIWKDFFLEEEIGWRSSHALQLAGYFTFSWSVIKFLLFVFFIRFFEPRLSHFKRISGLSLQLFLLEHLDRHYSERTGCVVRLHSFSQHCASVWILQMFYCSAVEMTDFVFFFSQFLVRLWMYYFGSEGTTLQVILICIFMTTDYFHRRLYFPFVKSLFYRVLLEMFTWTRNGILVCFSGVYPCQRSSLLIWLKFALNRGHFL